MQYDNNDSNEDDIGDDNDANSDWEVNAIRNQKKHNRGRHSAKHSPTYKSKNRKSGSSTKSTRSYKPLPPSIPSHGINVIPG